MSSSIDNNFLKALLAFPSETLDKKQIQFIFDMSNGTVSSSDKPKKSRKSSKTKEDDADKPKTKRKLNDKLVARNACWAEKKAEGMSYKDFQKFWKEMTDAEKAEYSPSASSAEQSENDDEKKEDNSNMEDEITIDDLEEALNDLETKPVEPEPVKKVSSKKSSKSSKK
jgi:hypothetical protein